MSSKQWSDILRSDLDKLSNQPGLHSKPENISLKDGERRNVTILFLDIQGFTAMSEKLDPEDVQLIIDRCFKILTNEIEKYEGHIDKYEGDRMMALFGVKQASEQDSERAVRAALGMKEKFIEVNQILSERDIKIGIRIGINSGLVVTGKIGKGRDQDFTVMGDPVNLASRLESNAPPNEIMVSEEIRKNTDALFTFEDLGKITVKGKSEAIAVFCVKGINSKQAEKWERSPFTQRVKFIGRDQEYRSIKSDIEKTLTQNITSGVLIAAPAGYGKSRLVYEIIKDIQHAYPQVSVIRVAGTASYQNPYGVVSELFKKIPRIDFADDSESIQKYHEFYDYLMNPSHAGAFIHALDPDTFKLQLHLTLKFVLENSPGTLVHLDDLQWFDQASIEAFQFVLQNMSAHTGVFFMLTCRPEFQKKWIGSGQINIQSVDLDPLNASDCEKILDNVLEGLALTPQDRSILVNRCDGNPFYMEELIQSLIDQGIIVRSNSGWTLTQSIADLVLPDSIQSIVISRVDKLDKACKDVLMAASVIGESLPEVVLNHASEKLVPRNLGLQPIHILIQLGFLYQKRERGEFGIQLAFRHILTRDVVYHMILNHNKKILHELVGSGLESELKDRSMDHAQLLFHHFYQASNLEKMKHYGFHALEECLKKNAAQDGLKVANALQTLTLDSTYQQKLIEALIRFYDFLGNRTEQQRLIEQLKSLEVSPALETHKNIQCLLHEAIYLNALGQFNDSELRASEALTMTLPEDVKSSLELYRVAGVACYSRAQYEKAKNYYEKGLALAIQTRDLSSEAGFYNTMGLIHFNLGRLAEALDFYKKALLIMQTLGHKRGEANSLGNQGLAYWSMGEYSQALLHLKKSHEIFKEIAFKKGQVVTLGNIGVIYHRLGLYDEALNIYETALMIRREIKDKAGEGYDLVNMGTVYLNLPDYEKAEQHFISALAIAREVGSNYLLCESLNSLGILFRKTSETHFENIRLAQTYVEEALALARQHQLLPAEIKATSNLAKIMWALHQKEKALALSQSAMTLIAHNKSGAEGAEEEAYINHYDLLVASGDQVSARACLNDLLLLIDDRASKIQEDIYRESFLKNVRQNRYALLEKEKQG